MGLNEATDPTVADAAAPRDGDAAPGPRRGQPMRESVTRSVIGLAAAAALTAASFLLAQSDFIYGPAAPVALMVLAVAQMGVHLVFFLNITTSPDNTNNVLALAFGVLIVSLVLAGSLWIMSNLNQMMPMDGARMDPAAPHHSPM